MRLARRHGTDLFEVVIPGWTGDHHAFDYRLRVTWKDGRVSEVDDPYRFGRILSDFDLHLIGEGTQLRTYEKLGAHAIELGPIAGVHFAVWAPNADRVSVVGDFNGWDGRVHPMRCLTPHGVWEIFIPGIGRGEKYKFEMRSKAGVVFTKADPYALRFELPPRSASIVWGVGGYEWGDEAWMAERAAAERRGSIGRCRSTRCTSDRGRAARTASGSCPTASWRTGSCRTCASMGFTHIELLPVMEHPFAGLVGLPGRRLLRADQPPGRRRTTSRCSWTRATRRASACSSTGCRATSRRTRTASRASTAPRSTSTRTRARASTRTGAR